MRASFRLLIACGLCLAACQSAVFDPPVAPPLRTDATEIIIADLQSYIPVRMQQAGIPGLTIALVQNGEVVWNAAFGVANQLTGQPLTPDAVFEVASLSKVVAAYTTLQITDTGHPSLDEPINPWLPPSWQLPAPYGPSVTMRQFLTHSSGMFNPGEGNEAVPGQSFYYTGRGYVRIQRVLETETGQSLEELANHYTFMPLGMTATSYTSPRSLLPRLANGHVRASYPLLRFLFPAVFLFGLMMSSALLFYHWRTGRWHCPRLIWGLAALGATALPLLIFSYLYRWSVPKMGFLITVTALTFTALLALLLLAGMQLRKHLPPAWQTPYRQRLIFSLWSFFSLVLLAGLSAGLTIPTPKGPARYPSAAGSLWSNAPDLAALMIEISDPQFLPADLAQQMVSPQIRVTPDISWGLGIGIQHSPQGDSLWHTGVHFDFNTLAVLYPETGNGVVILANSNHDEAALRDIAQRALGGKAAWDIPRDAQPSRLMPESNPQ